MRWILTVLLVILPGVARAGDKTECIGPDNAKMFFVYLHGKTQEDLTPLEHANRRVLTELSEKFSVRFALPKGQAQCKTAADRKCWTDGKEWDRTSYSLMDVIEGAAADCFRSQSYGLLGFSNGANFVSDLVRTCHRNEYNRLIAFAGGGEKTYEDLPVLQGCKPKLTLMVGRQDPAFNSIKDFYRRLKAKRADVDLIVYGGGHRLAFEPLAEALGGAEDGH